MFLNALWLKKRVINSLRNSGAQDVCNKMPRWFQISIPQKKLLKTQWKPLYITLAMALAYFGYGLIFQHLSYLFYLNFLLITHLNRWNGLQYFSHPWPCCGFFVCPCYSSRTHYPMLGKPSAQNIAVCENQGMQWKLRDQWKQQGI